MAKKAGVPPTGKKGKPSVDDKEQSERFKQTARELGVDKSGKGFEQIFKRIARPKDSGS